MLRSDLLGKIYTGVMALYFLVSGFSALMDIDSKLIRIGLNATDLDGKVAFILIYCSLMIGIGWSIILIALVSKTWVYSSILAVTIVISFICFRLVGAWIVGELSTLQISYILVETFEAAVGLFLIIRAPLWKEEHA